MEISVYFDPLKGSTSQISIEILQSFLWRRFTGKPVVASQNVSCFLRLPLVWTSLSGMYTTCRWTAEIHAPLNYFTIFVAK